MDYWADTEVLTGSEVCGSTEFSEDSKGG
ncbi:hypothetical protein BN874_940004 [Candidatus Contendobacter odensis Run_B_J11]|uniref:Uncharacterized protein n=1 Tax=Candidatus Contendobacter odensis Run_B_J11 TaxID=1400861 RepID=A0A7U7J667_9GAMM|nr:hypothetical protein BN874_940004 [Candidatus Contendobacter odensis Run_B_J11]